MSVDLLCFGEPMLEFNQLPRNPDGTRHFLEGHGGDTSNAAVAAAKDTASAKSEAERIIRAEYPTLPDAVIAAQAAPLATPWYRSFIAYDPRIALAKVKVPILALDGTKDVQVVSSQNLPAIRDATKTNRDVTIVELPGLNHLFQPATTGSPAEYATIEETVAPVALDLMSDWILQHTRR